MRPPNQAGRPTTAAHVRLEKIMNVRTLLAVAAGSMLLASPLAVQAATTAAKPHAVAAKPMAAKLAAKQSLASPKSTVGGYRLSELEENRTNLPNSSCGSAAAPLMFPPLLGGSRHDLPFAGLWLCGPRFIRCLCCWRRPCA